MIATLSASLARNRKFLPLAATISLFLIVYMCGVFSYPAMRDGQAFFNLFDAAPFLILTVVGETFVIISGGIDLSVSGILALTTVVAASLLYMGWSAWLIFPVVLLMGMVFGLVMGLFITYLKVQPFIATLAGMWLARGLCYVISDSEVRIQRSNLHDARTDEDPDPRAVESGHQERGLHYVSRGRGLGRARDRSVPCPLHALRPDRLRDGRRQRSERDIGPLHGVAG